MKRVLGLLVMAVAVMLMFTACGLIHGAPDVKEDVITIEDGYLVVNGVKTEHRVYSEPVVSVVDGYLAVNGIKTEYKVDADDVIEIVDGYVVVNGVKTEHKVDTPDVIEIINGYVYVNGIKTDIYVPSCNHSWTTVTTKPTCSAGGYDTKTCSLCGKSVVENETAKLEHTYSTTYSFDDINHWLECTGCDAKKDVVAHTPDADNNCTVCGTPLAVTPGIIYDVSVDGTYAEVIAYNGNATRIKIASEYNGLPVKNIYNEAFKNNRTITSVIIPDSVTTIGNNAFYCCSSIDTLVIGNSVTSIGYSAFYGCGSLCSVVIPDGVTVIDSYAFCGTSIKSVVIPDSVTTIGSGAFSGGLMGETNYHLESVVIGSGVTNIGWVAFASCTNLRSLVFKDGVTSIGDDSFRGCSSLNSVVIPNSVTNIGDSAFMNCSNLSSVVIGDSLTNIGKDAFKGCHESLYTEYEFGKYIGNEVNPYEVLIEITNKNMNTYTIHEDTKVIGPYVFSNCSRLSSIVIPDNVIGISDSAFANCSGISSLVIGSSVRNIGFEAFVACSNIKDIYYSGSETEWKSIYIQMMGNDILHTATKHYNYIPTP